MENLTVFFIPRSGRQYSIQTLMNSPLYLFRKMIISQLDLGPLVVHLFKFHLIRPRCCRVRRTKIP